MVLNKLELWVPPPEKVTQKIHYGQQRLAQNISYKEKVKEEGSLSYVCALSVRKKIITQKPDGTV